MGADHEDIHREEFVHLVDLSHDRALIAWGAFWFRRDETDGRWNILDDSELQEAVGRRTSIGHDAESFGDAQVEVLEPGGRVVATAPLVPGAFSVTLPEHALGQALEVLRTDTGASLLAVPIDLSAHQGFRWTSLAVRDGRVSGAFQLAASVPVLVELLDGERPHARGFTVPGPPHHRFALALPPPGRALPLVPRIGGMRLPGAAFILSADAAAAEPMQAAALGFLDGVEGLIATGWACNLADPASPLLVEALCDGRVIGAGLADLHRGDVADAGLPTPRCGFRLRLDGPLSALLGRDVAVRVRGASAPLPGSPQRVRQNPNITRLLNRAALPPALLARLSRRMAWQTRGALLSVVMPVHDTPRAWLVEALLSVRRQWCPNWELIVVDDGSTAPHVRDVLADAAAADPRVRVLRSPANLGIARAVNFGLRAVRGEWVAFLDHDDALEPDAVHALLTAAQASGADLLHSDEAVTTESLDDILEVRARPAFSHDYYLSHPYFVHLVCVRTALAQGLAGYDEGMAISADVDFVLRALERARRVAHVPRVLYRWRTHDGSAGHARQAEVMAATRGALQRHLDRLGAGASVSDGVGFNRFRTDWPDDPAGEVLVVVPTRNRVDLLRTCVESVERTGAGVRFRLVVIDHESDDPATLAYLGTLPHTVMRYAGAFNFAAMNNAAVRAHAGDARYLLLLNSDVVPAAPGWLPRLLAPLEADRAIGAAGPKLLFEDGSIQHAGLFFERDASDGIWLNRHFHKGYPRGHAPANRARAVPGVTGSTPDSDPVCAIPAGVGGRDVSGPNFRIASNTLISPAPIMPSGPPSSPAPATRSVVGSCSPVAAR